MQIEKIVVNSSPLIVLFRSGQSELFPHLFKKIVVPDQVYEEIMAGPDTDAAKKALPQIPWIERVNVDITVPVAAWNLGYGESAVFSFALNNPFFTAVVDDLAARRCAHTYGVRILGTGGIIILAKRRGVIDSVRNSVKLIRDAGLYLSDSVVNLMLSEAGE